MTLFSDKMLNHETLRSDFFFNDDFPVAVFFINTFWFCYCFTCVCAHAHFPCFTCHAFLLFNFTTTSEIIANFVSMIIVDTFYFCFYNCF